MGDAQKKMRVIVSIKKIPQRAIWHEKFWTASPSNTEVIFFFTISVLYMFVLILTKQVPAVDLLLHITNIIRDTVSIFMLLHSLLLSRLMYPFHPDAAPSAN